MSKPVYKPGEYIIYTNGDTYQLGRIKRLKQDGAFVFYHGGDTAAGTKFENMHKLENGYCITETVFPYEEAPEDKPGIGEEQELCESTIRCIDSIDNVVYIDPVVYDYVIGLVKKRIQELNSPQVTNYCPVCAERARKGED